MIPKKIHYCWFGGGNLSELEKRCIASWEKFCPEYEIIRWDESNYDVRKCRYMSQAYDAKKWGFVPDYARLDIVYTYGGIYLDTDVELIQSLDDLLDNELFCGQEDEITVNFGQGFGAVAGNVLLAEMMKQMEGMSFVKSDGEYDLTPSPYYQTQILRKNGFLLQNVYQSRDGVSIYPCDYFCPKNFSTGELVLSEHTHSIHHFHMSWKTAAQKKWIRRMQQFNRYFPPKLVRILLLPYTAACYIQDAGLKKTALSIGKNCAGTIAKILR